MLGPDKISIRDVGQIPGNTELVRSDQSTVGGPKWTKIDLFRRNGPKWTILVHFGLANAKIQFGIRSF